MTQEAIVTKCLSNNMAEVVVTRTTACGSNCGNCESCIFQNELKTPAKNLIGAKPGHRVIIESKSSKVYGAILLVYIMPIVLLLLGYFLAYSGGASEGICILCSFLGLLAGAAITVFSQKLKKNKDSITFEIISYNTNK